tara:strand:- start:519 stop:6341 length:5823 start_codon:yes stop_codon:yes gene_type:complete
MPEIKNSFVKGRMNLDLDKRIIPNGEYTESFNVQVSTSEDSDVGSVQNILGNDKFTSFLEDVPDTNLICIGSISDEKKNRFYWFVVISDDITGVDIASAIIEHNVDTVTSTPIIIDGDNSRLEFNSGSYITGINVVDDFLFFTDGVTEPKKINIEHFRQNAHTDLVDANNNIITSNFYVNNINTGNRFTKEDITVIKRKPTKPPVLKIETSAVYGSSADPETNVFVSPFAFVGYGPGSTQANPSITFTVPNTIAVPLNTQYIDPVTGLAADYENISGYTYNTSASGGVQFDVIDVVVGVPFTVGDIILMSDPDQPGSLPSNAQIRLEVINIEYIGGGPAPTLSNTMSSIVAVVELEVISIDPTLTGVEIAYDWSFENEQDILYETQFARFAYRYKYQDGEYSAFGPFTEVAFAAGVFGIHPTREPFNTGMENNITKIILKDFVTYDIPTEVVEIDLLYKKEDSTSIFSLDTIRPTTADGSPNMAWITFDGFNSNVTLPSGATKPASDTGYYEITKDLVYAAVPENQFLRPWDNVPKKAKAQDFTAGRLIYANYTQNIDLEPVDYTRMSLGIEHRGFHYTETSSFLTGEKSIKSQRTYQTGISFLDLYGRETPVFTSSENNSFNVKYNWQNGNSGNASRSNRLFINNIPTISNLTDTTPDFDPVYFKIFIKETSSEYHNLVLDRVYLAEEDGNLWLSFPSSDRNKIKEDDFIILKKQIGSSDQVNDENKFKVIDIKNEAPKFIRTKYKALGILDGGGTLTGAGGLYPDINNQPTPESSKIIISKNAFEDEDVNDVIPLFDAGKTITIDFQKTVAASTLRSRKYNIISIEEILIGSNDVYRIVIDRPIFTQDGWIETSTNVLDPDLKTQFSVEENKEFEEFQGRFFVKIISNIITAQYLQDQVGFTTSQTQITSSTQAFSLCDPSLFLINSGSNVNISYPVWQNAIPNTSDVSDTLSEWQTNLNFGGAAQNNNGVNGGWFIDAAYMASQQPTISPDDSLYANMGVANNGGTLVTPGANNLEFDVSCSGNLMKGEISQNFVPGSTNAIPGLSANFIATGWIHNTYGSAASSTTADIGWNFADGSWVDGLEGIREANDEYNNFTSSSYINIYGARAWKNQLGPWGTAGVADDVYGPSGSNGNYMHLSFSGVGVDLHNGTDTNVSGGNVFDFYENTATDCTDYESIAKINLQAIENFNTQVAAKTKVCNVKQDSAVDTDKTENQWNPAGASVLNNFNQGNQDLINNLIPGNKFRFSNDAAETVFTVLNVTEKRIYNHTAWNRRLVRSGGASNVLIEDKQTIHYAWHNFVKECVDGSTTSANDAFLELETKLKEFGAANNRRVCYIIELDQDPTDLIVNPESLGGPSSTVESLNIEFLEPFFENGLNPITNNPAIFETQPKENLDLDIFYEASQAYPIQLDQSDQIQTNNRKGHLAGAIGDKVRSSSLQGANTLVFSSLAEPEYIDCRVKSWNGDILELDLGLFSIDTLPSGLAADTNDLNDQTLIFSNSGIQIYKEDGSYVSFKIESIEEIIQNGYTSAAGNTYDIISKIRLKPKPNRVGLSYFNCFSFGNGVESNRIRDDFNKPFILNGVKASTTLQEQYKQDNRTSGLIFSGIYNKSTSLNDLNQFIMAEKITKELEPTYGSIQKLFARDSDLIALCQDKIVQIAADKDIIFNADGRPQLTASNKVLGQSRPFVGEHGISNNPESFASSSYRAYFADKQRGAVLRLSMDGLTPISSAGMKDFFKDKFKGNYFNILGSYDSNKDNYNLTFDNGASEDDAGSFLFNTDNKGENSDFKSTETDITITYKESVKGWESFKGFIPEAGLSCVNDYFTIRNGQIYKHTDSLRSFFYGNQQGSFITTVFNNAPTTVKHFNTLNYDGEQGWKCDFIETDLNTGTTLHDFLNKENKWFSTIIDNGVTVNNIVSNNSFNFQGIGVASNIEYNI